MSELGVTATFEIQEGQGGRFRELARQCIETVRAEDSGTHQYDWFFTADDRRCVVRERYRDSDAVLEHLANLGPIFGQLLEVATIHVDLFGEPSQQLLESTRQIDTTVYGFFAGL